VAESPDAKLHTPNLREAFATGQGPHESNHDHSSFNKDIIAAVETYCRLRLSDVENNASVKTRKDN
jgi:hypothetical protein